MSRAHNFSAGPASLPIEVLNQAAEEMTDYQGSGMSVMEMSHRSKIFVDIAAQAEADLRELMGVSDEYHCLLYTSPSPRDGLLSRMPSSA